MKLILFDVDGTLLSSDGAGRRAMEAALGDVFGSRGDPAHRYDGKTDVQIVREVLRAEGFGDGAVTSRIPELLERYLGNLEREVADPRRPPRPLQGVERLLDELESRDDVVLGLLTGNVAAGAEIKLEAAGIRFERFKVNAFGCDSELRPELPAFALRRARDVLGRAPRAEEFWIIGDTPADVACGRAGGTRTLAVATGHYGVEELAACSPDAVVESLADTPHVLRILLDA